MKISRIEVENFKSIEKYDFLINDFNVFIGKNNHGKTNLFEALNWFDSGKTTSNLYRNNETNSIIKVRVHFTGAQVGAGSLPDGAYKTKIKGILGEHDQFIVEKTSETDKRSIIVNSENLGNPTGIDPALNYFLPKVVYVTTKHKLTDVTGYKAKSPIAEMLADVLKDMVDNEPRYQAFLEMFDALFNETGSVFRTAVDDLQGRVETYLAKQFSEGATVKFKIENPAVEDMLKRFETDVDDGVKTKAEDKGDGMQRAIMLAIVQAYADYRKDKGIVRNFIFLIDEAELHLHPTAQRSLKVALRDIVSSGGQVLINSHSSIFANENFDNQLIYKVEKISGASMLKQIESPQEQLDSIYQLLGGSPRDILLPNNFIIVEGQSDYTFLQKIIERFYSENKKCSSIKILFARGDHEKQKELYYLINECYIPLSTNGIYKGRVVFLLEKPDPSKQTSFDEFKRTHSWLIEGEQLHQLPVVAIEMYYPAPFKKTDQEVRAMVAVKEKIDWARKTAESITKEQFQEEMPLIYNMLSKAIDLAYE